MERSNPNYWVGLADDASMLQAAVDAAALSGERVVIPRRNLRTGEDVWILSRALRLYSGSTLCLEGCRLRQADGIFDNIFRNDNACTPLGCTPEGRQYDIRIIGLGGAVLDGGHPNGLSELNVAESPYPSMTVNSPLHFHNVSRLSVENLRVEEPRYWGLTFQYCTEGHIADIDFRCGGKTPNQDGIDLRAGCSNFLIENITGCTGDDVVALTNLNHGYVEKLRVAGADPDTHDVIIRNVRAYTTDNRGIIRLLNHEGHRLYNIVVENILDTSPKGGLCRAGSAVRIGEHFYYKEKGPAQFGDMYNITVRNVLTRARTGVFVSNTLACALIDNVQMHGDGGTALYFRAGTMRDIRVRDIGSAPGCRHPAADNNAAEGNFNRRPATDAPSPDNRVYTVYFQGTDAKGLIFDGIRAGEAYDGVFGGFGDVHLRARGVSRGREGMPLVDGEGIRAEIEP